LSQNRKYISDGLAIAAIDSDVRIKTKILYILHTTLFKLALGVFALKV